jgi:V/A-type H+/Na+-transporting ATPase subunit D
MAEVKLTKAELRQQQLKFTQLQRYLPTLQLKKMLLQIEVNAAEAELQLAQEQKENLAQQVERFSPLFSDKGATDLFLAVKMTALRKHYENIAGVDVPHLEGVDFDPHFYPLFDTPLWVDPAIVWVRELIIAREKVKIVEEKKRALQQELMEVSIRVNLFEKILIPRTMGHIKRIKIFLGDQQLAAISQAKMAKKKINVKVR